MDMHGGTPPGHGVAITGVDGKFEIGGMGEGRMVLKVFPSKAFDGSPAIDVVPEGGMRITVSPRVR
jgi:hypothetical protein